jgi:hypothetical protein
MNWFQLFQRYYTILSLCDYDDDDDDDVADFPVPKHQWILVRLSKYPAALGRQ